MSRIAPYVPFPVSQKHVTQEDMWQTLAKHAKPQVQIPNETQSPQAKPAVTLEWEEPVWTSADHSTGYILSRCGHWSVSKVRTGPVTNYEACKRPTRSSPQPELLDIKPTPDEAKRVCQEHANR